MLRWSAWVRAGNQLRLSWLPKSVYYEPIEIITGREIEYNDEECETTDGILASMKIQGLEYLRDPLIMKYLYGCSNKEIARKLKINENSLRCNRLNIGHAWLDGRFRANDIYIPAYIEAKEKTG